MYVELHTSSAFSFLEAASLPETLVEQAARFDYPALALLDRDGVYGAPRFHRAATAAGIKAIIGAELTLQPTFAQVGVAGSAFAQATDRFHLRASVDRPPGHQRPATSHQLPATSRTDVMT